MNTIRSCFLEQDLSPPGSDPHVAIFGPEHKIWG
jgi:hypothetical protein